MKGDLFENIIKKFLEGNATPHEKRMLSNWLKEDPRREEIFYFQVSKRENEGLQYLPETDSKIEAYEKFLIGQKRISEVGFNKYQNDPVHSISFNRNWWWAAAVTLLLSASFFFLNDSFFYKTYTTQNGMIRSVTLQDGSKVTLNANSSIKVPRGFVGNESRGIWIKGEAFFEVTRKSKRMKFIVHTDNVDIEVLGTKFNINNRHGKTEVMLAEGKVVLVAKDQKTLIMKPGEQVSIQGEQGLFQKLVVKPEKYKAWQYNKLVFENTPLAEVAQIIQDYYGVKVIVSDSLLATRQFTGTLPNNDLEVIFLALSAAYKIEIEHQEDRFILKLNKP